jgi:hypothetical protein
LAPPPIAAPPSQFAGQAIGKSANVEVRAEALPRAGRHQSADRQVRIDAIKGLAQSREVRRLEPVVLARTIEAHHGAPVGHIDARRCRLAANIRVIGIRNLSGCSPLGLACKRAWQSNAFGQGVGGFDG